MSLLAPLRSLVTKAAPATSRAFHVSRSSLQRSERQTCTLIPGDGVGPELVNSVEEVFKSAGVPVDFEVFFLSEIHHALSVPIDQVAESVRRNKVCLKGILGTPEHSFEGELASLNIKLRRELDLYAKVVHVKSSPGVATRHNNIDIVIIREQIEGEYSSLEHESVPGVVECLKIVTAERSKNIAKFAFDYATKHGRKKVTAVHKANIMKLGDGLFLRCCQEMAELYPHIEFESMIVDNTTMQIVSNPHQFDVMVAPNLYGNILDNLAAGLVGGAGLVPGASYSSECVCFEPGARHAFSSAAGKNVANPTAMLLASADMLQHLNLVHHSKAIRNAVAHVLRAGKVKTKDLGGHSTTKQFTAAIIEQLKNNKRDFLREYDDDWNCVGVQSVEDRVKAKPLEKAKRPPEYIDPSLDGLPEVMVVQKKEKDPT